ncbi:MAG: NAD(P)-dependent oxidoreductase [Nanoarchaeota archaeon]
MKLLLTGASGFIGKNFLELAPKDIEITGIYNNSKDIINFVREKNLKNVELYKCDLTKENNAKELFRKIGKNFEYCIFLAGNVNVPLSKKDPMKDIEITVGSLINTLQNCRIKRLVYMSTAGVYDGIKGHVDANAKLNPTVPYCISKLMAEQYIKFYNSIGKVDEYVILRFGGAFGKYSENKFITKLVKDICMHNRKEIESYGDGTNLINVMYVKDAVKALVACLKSKKSDIVCNLALENMTIKEAVERVSNAFGKDVKIKYKPRIKEQKYITFAYDSDFNNIFGFTPDYSFEQGIKEFGKELKNEN